MSDYQEFTGRLEDDNGGVLFARINGHLDSESGPTLKAWFGGFTLESDETPFPHPGGVIITDDGMKLAIVIEYTDVIDKVFKFRGSGGPTKATEA